MTDASLHGSDNLVTTRGQVHEKPPIKIAIYVVTTAAIELTPLQRTLYGRLKTSLRRRLDLLYWRLTGHWRGHYSTFQDYVHCNRGDFAIRLGLRQQIAAAFRPANVIIEEVPWGCLNVLQSRTPEDMPDILVLCGGGFLFPDKHGRIAQWVIDEIGILEQLPCPVVAASLGINYSLEHGDEPILDDAARDAARRLLSCVQACSVRCTITADLVPQLGPVRPSILVDPAFLLFPPARPAHKHDGRVRIGINMAFHGVSTSLLQQRTLSIFIAALRALSAEIDCEFLYFVHSDAERAITAALRLAGVPCAVVHDSLEQLVAGYGTLDLHIGQMLHSAILAMSQNTPALVLGYDIKAIGMMRLMDLEDCFLNMYETDAAAIVRAAKDMLSRREEFVARIVDRRRLLESTSQTFYRGLRRLPQRARAAAE